MHREFGEQAVHDDEYVLRILAQEPSLYIHAFRFWPVDAMPQTFFFFLLLLLLVLFFIFYVVAFLFSMFRPNIDRHYSYGKIEASAKCIYITLIICMIYLYFIAFSTLFVDST